jgi:hypothetical protein
MAENTLLNEAMKEQWEEQEKNRIRNLKDALKAALREKIFRRKKFYHAKFDPAANGDTWWIQTLMEERPSSESDAEKNRAMEFFKGHIKAELTQLRNNRQTACKGRFENGK